MSGGSTYRRHPLDIPVPTECRELIDRGATVAISHSGRKGTQGMVLLLSRIFPVGHCSPPSAVLTGRYEFPLRTSFDLLSRQPAPCLAAHSYPPPRSRRRADPTPGRGLCSSRWPSPLHRPRPRVRPEPPKFPAPHTATLRRSTTPDDPSRLAAHGTAGAALRLTTLKASSIFPTHCLKTRGRPRRGHRGTDHVPILRPIFSRVNEEAALVL